MNILVYENSINNSNEIIIFDKKYSSSIENLRTLIFEDLYLNVKESSINAFENVICFNVDFEDVSIRGFLNSSFSSYWCNVYIDNKKMEEKEIIKLNIEDCIDKPQYPLTENFLDSIFATIIKLAS